MDLQFAGCSAGPRGATEEAEDCNAVVLLRVLRVLRVRRSCSAPLLRVSLPSTSEVQIHREVHPDRSEGLGTTSAGGSRSGDLRSLRNLRPLFYLLRMP